MPRKTVTVQLEIDSDFESSIYDAIGQLLSGIEDNDLFTIKDVNVQDVAKTTISLPNLSKEMSGVKRDGRYGPSYNDF